MASVLIYEGHDVSRTALNPNPKLVDQPRIDSGRETHSKRAYLRGSRASEEWQVFT